MPRDGNQVRILQSLLDRLIDNNPGVSSEPPSSRQKGLRELKLAVRRDLEWLLNTRQSIADLPEGLEETADSLATYGLPDFTGVSARGSSAQESIRRSIEEEIRLFEPRLQDVYVSLEPAAGEGGTLHFRIDAQLKLDPEPEPVTFDTTLQLYSGECSIQGVE